ncbi:hypothetical protein ACHAXR_008148 [Thalassiosira sp. AJA248-18]
MGISDLLPHLPGGKHFHHSFYSLGREGRVVPIDAAGALFQFATYSAHDFLREIYQPALRQWARFLIYLRSICGWNMIIYLDGMENVHKEPENERRKKARQSAVERNDLRGQIKNNPNYIAKAMKLVPVTVTGDSDLLAYGVPSLIIVKGYHYEWYRTLDLTVETKEGEYPLFDLYKSMGQLCFSYMLQSVGVTSLLPNVE